LVFAFGDFWRHVTVFAFGDSYLHLGILNRKSIFERASLHLGLLIPLLLIDEQAFGHFGFLIEQGIRIVHSEQQAF
jgi:hypothetical protein